MVKRARVGRVTISGGILDIGGSIYPPRTDRMEGVPRTGTPPMVLAAPVVWPSPPTQIPASTQRKECVVVAASAAESEALEDDAVASLLHLTSAAGARNPADASVPIVRSETTGAYKADDADSDHSADTVRMPTGERKISAQERHNATERRRVQKLKEAYTTLDDLIRSRPDLVSVQRPSPPPKQAGAGAGVSGGRKRVRQDAESGSGTPQLPTGPASHLEVLQGTAGAVSQLYRLVDQLARRNAELEQALRGATTE